MRQLSRREMQALTLIKGGMRNKEMAETMGINEKSISTYILRLYTKLGLSMKKNRYALVMRAKELDVIE